jgi:hypothetical protein
VLTRIEKLAPARQFCRVLLQWRGGVVAILVAGLLTGCEWQPSRREVQNARAFEALLTAVSLKNKAELERDARVVDERHARGELSRTNYEILREVIVRARAGEWKSAEERAYDFRKQFGDRGAYFD